MASFDSSSSPTLSLLALPGEIKNAIIAGLNLPDLQTLRLTNHYFYALIPPMPSDRLFQIEKEFMPYRYFACMECKRLRHITNFIPGTMSLLKRLPTSSAFIQRCRECVRLKFKEPGSRWMECNVPIVRCVECKEAGQALVDTRVQYCLSCLPEDSKSGKSTQKKKRTQKIRRSKSIKASDKSIQERKRVQIIRRSKRINCG
jgi:hypothetical protein